MKEAFRHIINADLMLSYKPLRTGSTAIDLRRRQFFQFLRGQQLSFAKETSPSIFARSIPWSTKKINPLHFTRSTRTTYEENNNKSFVQNQRRVRNDLKLRCVLKNSIQKTPCESKAKMHANVNNDATMSVSTILDHDVSVKMLNHVKINHVRPKCHCSTQSNRKRSILNRHIKNTQQNDLTSAK